MFGVHLEAALSDGTEDLRQMKSRVLTLAIISAIIQHPKYMHNLVAAAPFLQPLQRSFCMQFEISVFDGCVIFSTPRSVRGFCSSAYKEPVHGKS